MVFSSATFLFYFLPTVLLLIGFGYLTLKPFASARTQTVLVNAILLVSSIGFYYWGEKERVGVLLAVILLTYASGLLIERGSRHSQIGLRRIGLWIGLLSNGGFLVWFKYSYFAYETLSPILEGVGIGNSPAIAQVALPLGISFFTFQAVSYLLDVYWRKTPATHNLLHFSCYITFFPQLVAGPIVRYNDIRCDIQQRQMSFDWVVQGASRFIVGLAKKVLVANPVGQLADELFAMPPQDLSTGGCWLACIAYGVQILFDFSGYSDMAIGLAKILGIEIPENFRSPYKRDSVRAFWRNWHISLSTWFRDYLYIPLGGSRTPGLRTFLNLNIVFLACGLWHGASFTFIAWGLYHGLFLTAEHFLEKRGWLQPIHFPRLLRRLYTLLVVFLGWILFRSDSIDQALDIYSYMLFNIEPLRNTNLPLSFFSLEIQIPLLFGVVASTMAVPKFLLQKLAPHYTVILIAKRLLLLTALGLSLVYVAISSYNPFIYFRF